MLIIEKGKSRTAPAETASVKVLRHSLEEKRPRSPAIGGSKEHGRNSKRTKTLKPLNPKKLHKIFIKYMELGDKCCMYYTRSSIRYTPKRLTLWKRSVTRTSRPYKNHIEKTKYSAHFTKNKPSSLSSFKFKYLFHNCI